MLQIKLEHNGAILSFVNITNNHMQPSMADKQLYEVTYKDKTFIIHGHRSEGEIVIAARALNRLVGIQEIEKSKVKHSVKVHLKCNGLVARQGLLKRLINDLKTGLSINRQTDKLKSIGSKEDDYFIEVIKKGVKI